MIRRQLPAYSPLRPGGQVSAAIRSLSSPDEAVSELRRRLVDRFGAEDVLLTDGATSGLRLALEFGHRVGPGAERPVALPAYCCFDIVTAAVGAGTPALFYDIDPNTLAPDPASLEAALRAGAGTIVAANLYGHPLDLGTLRSLADEHGALLIEDAAQGLGAEWREHGVGTVGDIALLSFGRGKGWTGGGGGALLVRGAATSFADGVALEPSGRGTGGVLKGLALWGLGRPSLYRLPSSVPGLGLGETHYKEPEPPRTISAFSAAAALETEAGSFAQVEPRRRAAARWDALVGASGADGFTPCKPVEGGRSGYLRYPLLGSSASEARGLEQRAADFGIGPAYPVVLPELPQAAPIVKEHGSWPGARTLVDRLVTLPTHPRVGEPDFEGLENLLASGA